MSPTCEVIHCQTLDEYWDLISPVGEAFGQKGSDFIFRGQGDGEWKLVPRVFRAEVLQQYKAGMWSVLSDNPGQFFFEWVLLWTFMQYCDSIGLQVPNDSMEFRRYFSQDHITNIHGINTSLWPQDQVIPLMALAQHHGVPTRLLDWSNSPFKASYFAAASALSPEMASPDKKIALFGLDLNQRAVVRGIRHVRVPGSISANVSSQGGSFVLIDNNRLRGQPFITDVSLESKLPSEHSKPILKKITLPLSLAGALWLRCNKFGYTAASIFPGYDGAGKAVKEHFLMKNLSE